MASDVRIWTGSAWESIKGDQGPAGPTVVSADAGNVAKLGTDGRISVQPADMDSRFVNVTGDTMTGPLSVSYNTAPPAEGQISVTAEGQASTAWTTYNATPNTASVVRLRKARGTEGAPAPVQAGDALGYIVMMGHDGTAYRAAGNIRVNCVQNPSAGDTGIVTEWLFNVGTTASALQQMKLDSSGVTAQNVNATFLNSQFVNVAQVLKCAESVQIDSKYPSPISVNATGQAGSYVIGVRSAVDGVTDNTQCFSAVNYGQGKDLNTAYSCGPELPAGQDNFVLWSASPAKSWLYGPLGLNWSDPTHQLEVAGETMLRGPLDVTGNITSSGTAHNFAANSIPLSAVANAVSKAGDTMTGNLVVDREAASTIGVNAYSDTGNAVVRFQRTRGTKAAPTTLVANDYVGRLTYAAADTGGTFRTSAFSCQVVSVAAAGVETRYNFIVSTATGGSVTPLLVTKDGISVTGSITSTGAAHDFAAGSIPAAAVIGGTASTPTAGTAGAAGSMRWDEDFLYIRTETAWKKVALTAL